MLPFPLPSTTVAMLLADARLPSGGHAHSAGLEPALLAGGLAVAEVPAALLARARTTSLVEAGTAVVARHLALTAPESLPEVEAEWAARTPSPAQRDAARVLGRGLLRLADRLWPASLPLALIGRDGTHPPRALVLGAIAAEAGMEPLDLARLAVYDDAASAAAALLKLEPRDPAEVTGWVVETCAAVDDALREAAALTDPAAIPAASAPQAEDWAEAHALLNRRLFRA
ncbi:urease accessory protein UreF [Microbacterium sp.]|uniref:urease accessory protein UreF n=1 Tax=Microbacterium sp. TaxID=51671 RepID=UPI0039E53EC9